MRQQEMLMLRREDRDRLKVLHEVKRGHITQGEAGQQLRLSERWVRKLVARIYQQGDAGVIHQLRGQPSNRKIAEKEREKAVRLIEAKYADFGLTLAAEYLAEKHGVLVSKETLRQ
jgi:DNA-binding Lrp family transcriptional regulator